MKKFLLMLAFCGVTSGCLNGFTEPDNVCTDFLQTYGAANGDTVAASEGVRYIDIAMGAGTPALWGDFMLVNYAGYFISGTPFDSSCGAGKNPLVVQLGDIRYNYGFMLGLVGMKTFGVRRMIIPVALGYPGDTEERIFDIHLIQRGR